MHRADSPTVSWLSETVHLLFAYVHLMITFCFLFFTFTQETDDLEESDSQPPKKHHHYFWDPYETAFMTSEPAYTVDKYARIYFPVTFAVLNSIYWIVYAPDKVIFWTCRRMRRRRCQLSPMSWHWTRSAPTARNDTLGHTGWKIRHQEPSHANLSLPSCCN